MLQRSYHGIVQTYGFVTEEHHVWSRRHRGSQTVFPFFFQIDALIIADKLIRFFLYKFRLSAITDDAYGNIVNSRFQYPGWNTVDTGWILIAGSSCKCTVYVYGVRIYDAT